MVLKQFLNSIMCDLEPCLVEKAVFNAVSFTKQSSHLAESRSSLHDTQGIVQENGDVGPFEAEWP